MGAQNVQSIFVWVVFCFVGVDVVGFGAAIHLLLRKIFKPFQANVSLFLNLCYRKIDISYSLILFHFVCPAVVVVVAVWLSSAASFAYTLNNEKKHHTNKLMDSKI